MRIIGIDPGYDRCGFAVIDRIKNKNNIIAYGVISTNKNTSKNDRIFEVGKDFSNIIKQYKPDTLNIEGLFFTNNVTSGLAVAEVRGMIIWIAKKNNITIYEPSPNQIKQQFTGHGRASKKDIKNMITLSTNIKPKDEIDDAFDAIAIAYFQ